jgi:hypothetical protein
LNPLSMVYYGMIHDKAPIFPMVVSQILLLCPEYAFCVPKDM